MKSSLENLSTLFPVVIARFMRATQFVFSNKERWVARTSRAMTDWGSLFRNSATLILALSVVLGVSGCGVKNDLVLPDGKPSPKGEKDPSKPPSQQQGR